MANIGDGVSVENDSFFKKNIYLAAAHGIFIAAFGSSVVVSRLL